MKLIEWQQNWGGGELRLDGETLTEQRLPDDKVELHKNAIKVGEGVIKGFRRESFTDHDHGHTYCGKTLDFNVTLPPTGVGVNIRELIRQGFQVYGTLKETGDATPQ